MNSVNREGDGAVEVFTANLTANGFSYFCVKIPSLIKTKDAIIAFGEGRIGSCADVAPTHLIYRMSHDQGGSWGEVNIFHQDGDNVIGNIAPVVLPNGLILAPFTKNNRLAMMSRSQDGGLTWETPETTPDLLKEDWIWVGYGPPASLVLKSGKVLIPGYHSTTDVSNSSSIGSGLTKGHIVVSEDNGLTFRLASTSFGNNFFVNELQAAQMSNGTVIINSRVLSSERVLSYSNDEGESFYSVRRPSTPLHETIQGCEGSFIRVDGTDRLLYSGVEGRIPARIFRENITLRESNDFGVTWTTRSIIDVGSSGYSALLNIDPDTVAVLYETSDCIKCPLVFLPTKIKFKKLII